jgi:hypothetical protein
MKMTVDVDKFVPWVEIGKCLFFGSIFVIAAGFTLETTQALFMHQNPNNIGINWSVFLQIPDALQGKYTGSMLDAILWSWVLLACYVIAKSIKHWVKTGVAEEGLELFCHLLIGLDGFANYSFMSGHEWWYQIGFTVMICVVLMYFGQLAISFLMAGLSQL